MLDENRPNLRFEKSDLLVSRRSHDSRCFGEQGRCEQQESCGALQFHPVSIVVLHHLSHAQWRPRSGGPAHPPAAESEWEVLRQLLQLHFHGSV